MYTLNVQVTAYGRQTVSDRGVVRSCDPLQNFCGSNDITGTAEPKVVKFCTRVGYTNSNNWMTYHQQKWHGYGHMIVLKFCRLLWCNALCGFVSDNWATCDAIPACDTHTQTDRHTTSQGCSLVLDISVSIQCRDVVSERLGLVETWEGNGLDLVSDWKSNIWVSSYSRTIRVSFTITSQYKQLQNYTYIVLNDFIDSQVYCNYLLFS